eukprot:351277-Chlamydomonas_euryale.AAC.3
MLATMLAAWSREAPEDLGEGMRSGCDEDARERCGSVSSTARRRALVHARHDPRLTVKDGAHTSQSTPPRKAISLKYLPRVPSDWPAPPPPSQIDRQEDTEGEGRRGKGGDREAFQAHSPLNWLIRKGATRHVAFFTLAPAPHSSSSSSPNLLNVQTARMARQRATVRQPAPPDTKRARDSSGAGGAPKNAPSKDEALNAAALERAPAEPFLLTHEAASQLGRSSSAPSPPVRSSSTHQERSARHRAQRRAAGPRAGADAARRVRRCASRGARGRALATLCASKG